MQGADSPPGGPGFSHVPPPPAMSQGFLRILNSYLPLGNRYLELFWLFSPVTAIKSPPFSKLPFSRVPGQALLPPCLPQPWLCICCSLCLEPLIQNQLLPIHREPAATWLYLYLIFFFFFLLFGTVPATYGSSQARGQIADAAASLLHSHSHSHAGSLAH